jgi:hypothetical protein
MNKWILIYLSLVFLSLPLTAGCVTNTTSNMERINEFNRSIISKISLEQIDQLSHLEPGKATIADVTNLLGKPGEGSNNRVICYTTGLKWNDNGLISETTYLVVFIFGDRYQGYQWTDPLNSLSSDKLRSAIKLMEKKVSISELRQNLGTPAAIGKISNKEFIWGYNFDSPSQLSSFEISSLKFAWHVNERGEAQFFVATPSFSFRGDQGPKGFGNIFKIPKYYKDLAIIMMGMDIAVRKNVTISLPASGMEKEREQLAQGYQELVDKKIQHSKAVSKESEVSRTDKILQRLLKNNPYNRNFNQIIVIILDDKEITAMAQRKRGEQKIVLTLGLFQKISNDDQIAAILAHEMGHFLLDHFYIPLNFILRRNIDPQMFRSSQCMEHEADVFSVELMRAAGFNQQVAVDTIRILSEQDPPVPEKLSTHPPGLVRQEFLSWYINYRWPKSEGNTLKR